MADRKYHYEDRWGELREQIDKLFDEVKGKSPDAYEDAFAHLEEAEEMLDAVNDVLYELDHGGYDDDE